MPCNLQVRDIMKRLWENEAALCSYICDIQHQQNKISGNMGGYSMFFLETILVPPIRFRPPSISGVSVSIRNPLCLCSLCLMVLVSPELNACHQHDVMLTLNM